MAFTKPELANAIKNYPDVREAFEKAVNAAVEAETANFFRMPKRAFSAMQRVSELLTAFGKASGCRYPACDTNSLMTNRLGRSQVSY